MDGHSARKLFLADKAKCLMRYPQAAHSIES
jgi:hypothetical protein